MIKFLLKGVIKDKSRSLLPVIVISIGVMLTVLMSCWLKGVIGESLVINANFNTGHVKVMTRAYAAEPEQIPNDLAIIGVDSLITNLKNDYPDMEWVSRIRFGGLADFPDDSGETRAQGPVTGWAIDLFSNDSKETERFNIRKSIIKGTIPESPGQALISEDFARNYNIKPGDKFTLFGTTMEGGMAFKNFTVAGTVNFGAEAVDRGALIIDITDARKAFLMNDAAGEILGYFNSTYYDNQKATYVTNSFNKKYADKNGEFEPVMYRLIDQGGVADFYEISNTLGAILIMVFMLAMSVVLWNAGLLGSLRRYNEFGIRLALGEGKKHIYITLLYEGLIVGIIGSVTGTLAGLGFSYYLQAKGIDISGMMQSSNLMMPSVVRAVITPEAFYIGFIPGVFSTILGNALAGIGIYKRSTARLFKELEV